MIESQHQLQKGRKLEIIMYIRRERQLLSTSADFRRKCFRKHPTQASEHLIQFRMKTRQLEAPRLPIHALVPRNRLRIHDGLFVSPVDASAQKTSVGILPRPRKINSLFARRPSARRQSTRLHDNDCAVVLACSICLPTLPSSLLSVHVCACLLTCLPICPPAYASMSIQFLEAIPMQDTLCVHFHNCSRRRFVSTFAVKLFC